MSVPQRTWLVAAIAAALLGAAAVAPPPRAEVALDAAASDPPDETVAGDEEHILAGCRSYSCATVDELEACASSPSIDLAEVVREMNRCKWHPKADAARIERAMLRLAFRDGKVDPKLRDAMVVAGALTAEQADVMAAAPAKIDALFHSRDDQYQSLHVGNCHITSAGPSRPLELWCRAHSGCLRSCRDRILVAGIRAEASIFRVTLANVETEDTGGGGCCRPVRR